MIIHESILDNVEATDNPAASQIVSSSESTNRLPNPYNDTDEFDILLSIPVTSVDGLNYDAIIKIRDKVYDFFDSHPSVLSYSRILIGSWFHFFENDPDIRHDISNRNKKFDTIFLIAIKMNFRTFIDIASFMTGLYSIVHGSQVSNDAILFIKRNPETERFDFDVNVWDPSMNDRIVECLYFRVIGAIKQKNRRLNGREFTELINLCALLTKGHLTMNMYKKIEGGTSFSVADRVFNSVMGNTLRAVRIDGLSDFLNNNAFDAYSLYNERQLTIEDRVSSYFLLIPVNKMDDTPSYEGRIWFGRPRNLYSKENNEMLDFLQERLDGRPILSYSIERIYLRTTSNFNNAPVKLALYFGVDEIPGYELPCFVLFILSVDKPNNAEECADFLYRFKHIFKTEPPKELCLRILDSFMNNDYK